MKLKLTLKQEKDLNHIEILTVDSYYFDKQYLVIYSDSRTKTYHFKLTTVFALICTKD